MENILRILSNLLHLRHPNTIVIKEYRNYSFKGQSIDSIRYHVSKFKYNRTYFIDRKLKESERYINRDGEISLSAFVWIQRMRGQRNCFLIFEDFPGSEIWQRIDESDLAKFILESDAEVIERTMLDCVVEGKGFNEE